MSFLIETCKKSEYLLEQFSNFMIDWGANKSWNRISIFSYLNPVTDLQEAFGRCTTLLIVLPPGERCRLAVFFEDQSGLVPAPLHRLQKHLMNRDWGLWARTRRLHPQIDRLVSAGAPQLVGRGQGCCQTLCRHGNDPGLLCNMTAGTVTHSRHSRLRKHLLPSSKTAGLLLRKICGVKKKKVWTHS